MRTVFLCMYHLKYAFYTYIQFYGKVDFMNVLGFKTHV
jgi:hypothetical protein